MTRRDVERVCRSIAARCSLPAQILLIGAGARIVQAGARVTEDLDFELQPPAGSSRDRVLRELLEGVEAARRETGTRIQAAETVERWSMIDWTGYRDHQVLWKRFGPVAVYVLEPEHFALSKLARSSQRDLADIRRVFAVRKGSWRKLARVCGRALRESPRSTALDLFRRQVEHFFRTEGPAIWGSRFDPAAAIALFAKSYGPGTAAGD